MALKNAGWAFFLGKIFTGLVEVIKRERVGRWKRKKIKGNENKITKYENPRTNIVTKCKLMCLRLTDVY